MTFFTHTDPDEPEPGVVSEHFEGVDHKQDHYNGQGQRVDVRRDAQTGTVQETEQAERPDDTKNGRQFHQVLLGEVVPGIEFENQHVINPGRPPPVHVHPDQEQKLDDQKRSPVEAECDLEAVSCAVVEDCCKEELWGGFDVLGVIPDKTTAINRTMKEPEKRPTLKVVQGLCCSPKGGTRSLFMAFCLSPPSSSLVTALSVSLMSLSMSLFV
jgi:hypothetical protein